MRDDIYTAGAVNYKQGAIVAEPSTLLCLAAGATS